jgi:uncharacterized protein (TIGR00369 family)
MIVAEQKRQIAGAPASNAGLSRADLEALIERAPYIRDLGLRLIDFGAGYAEVRSKIEPRFRQHHGFANGGLVASLADTACAFAGASLAGDVVTVEYKVNFLAPAVGHELVSRGSVIRSGSRQVVARADVFSVTAGEERLVATAIATLARAH